MSKENNKIDINKHEIDIDTLKKQNVNDLLSIKELYKRIEEVGEKITQIKYIDSSLTKKLKKEYENLKRVILNENIQVELNSKIEETKTELNEVSSQMDTKANKLNEHPSYNAIEIGCDNKGIQSCSEIIQSYLNAGKKVIFPTGTYKLKIHMKSKSIIEGESQENVIFIPEDGEKDYVIKATLSDYAYSVKNIHINGNNNRGIDETNTIKGIHLSNEGTLAEQDLEPVIENVKIINARTGLHIDSGIRGGLFKNIKVGACYIGINHQSTDCIFKDCITAQTQSHGIFNLQGNNTFVNCKTFLAGSSKKIGAGIKNQGSYNRFINCECQQNVLENFHLQNSNYNMIQGLVLDGAGYKSKDWFPNMTYQEEGGEVPISSLRLYNSNGNIIDATIIDGRIDSYCKTALFNQWVSDDKDNIIRITTNNSATDSTMIDYILSDENTYFNNNSITINGVLKKDVSLKTPTIIDEQIEILDGGYIVDNGVCYISITLKALKTQSWGSEILTGLPKPFTTIPLSSSSSSIRSGLKTNGRINYNPSFNEGDTFTISGSYIIK